MRYPGPGSARAAGALARATVLAALVRVVDARKAELDACEILAGNAR
jgi:hypothetical protein